MIRSKAIITAAAFILGLASLMMLIVLSLTGSSRRVSANADPTQLTDANQTGSLKQIKTARATLTQMLADAERRPSSISRAEVLKAFALYETAINSRTTQIIGKLKELDTRIPGVGVNRGVDSAAHRKAIAEGLNKSGVKDEYEMLSRELKSLRNEVQEFSAKVAGVATPACPPPAINNTLGGTSPDFPSTTGTQTGRITIDGNASACEVIELINPPAKTVTRAAAAAGVKTCPGVEDPTGQRTFDRYEFVNSGCGSVCVTVTMSVDTQATGAAEFGAAANDLFPVVYLTSFNPSDLCQNYLADPGASPVTGTPVTFSFDVPSLATFIIVVHEVTAGTGTGAPYTLSISGLCQPCQIGCPEDFFGSTDPNLCTATVTYPLPLTCGECGTLTCTPPPGSVFPAGSTAINCSTEAQSAPCSFNVIVLDQQPPTIVCPANITALTGVSSCQSATSKVITFPTPPVSDNCGSATAVVCSPMSGTVFPVGTTTVTCASTDAADNTAVCTFSVSVFNASLQDDSNPNNVLLLNTVSGAYSFCCNGTTFTGTGNVSIRGCTMTLQHNPAVRRVLATIDFSAKKGSASLQSPVGKLRCSIADRDITNNTHSCP